ncbi:hypothetical protein CIT14_21715, partial [Virgibacillus profundi]
MAGADEQGCVEEGPDVRKRGRAQPAAAGRMVWGAAERAARPAAGAARPPAGGPVLPVGAAGPGAVTAHVRQPRQ